MRKPDWAQRMVEKAGGAASEYLFSTPVVSQGTAVNFLRAHHRKVKRMVLEVGKDFSWSTSVASAIRDILAKLKELER